MSTDDLRAAPPSGGDERAPIGANVYVLRCGWCGAYEGTVDRDEPCARDAGSGDYIGPHQFAVYEPVGGSPRETDWDAQVERVAMAMWAEYRMGFVARGGAPLPPPDWPEITHDARTNYRARARAALSTPPRTPSEAP